MWIPCRPLRDKVCEFAHAVYKTDETKDISIRLIVDHIRSATFMISDGIMPSNEGRGYVLRRLIRRAARHGRLLGIEGAFLSKLSATVIEGSKDGYPELEEKKDFIFKVLAQEEDKFNKTIDQGLSILASMEADLEKAGEKTLSGENAFALYDTYGFPLDLTKEILGEKGCTVDEEGFHACMEKQRTQARNARAVTNYMGADATVYDELPVDLTTEFDGYETLREEAEITALTTESEVSEALSDGQRGTIITDRTPFYATMGGQEGDRGRDFLRRRRICGGGRHSSAGRQGRPCGLRILRYAEGGRQGDAFSGRLLQKKYGKEPQRHPSAAEGAENGAGKPCRAEGLSGNAGPSPV